MNNRPTPETDAAQKIVSSRHGHWDVWEHARKLERERDEAREHLAQIKEYGTEEINAAVELRQQLASVLVERDKAREDATNYYAKIGELTEERDDALSQIVQAECRAERFCQERDEAREERDKLQVMRLEVVAANKGAKINAHINNSLTAKLAEAKRERDKARELAGAYKEYAQLLGDEINSMATVAHFHGWKSSRVEQGKVLREKIKQMEEAK